MTERHRLRPWWRSLPTSRLWIAAIVFAGVAFLIGSVILSQQGKTTAQSETQVVTGQRDAAGAQAQDLAVQLQAACAAGALPKTLCDTAAKVAADPVPGPVGPTGPSGDPGTQGIQGVPGAAGAVGPAGAAGDTGPSGPAGPSGAAGQPGADGAPGAAGPQGPSGRDGSPAASSTFTYPDGSTQTCTRSGGPDTAPTYLCDPLMPAPLLGPP